MKVSDLYNICLELIETDKAHYEVFLVDRDDIYVVINKCHIIDEDESLILND